MTPNLNPNMFITLTIGVFAFIFIMLLPALLELKRPKDAGPKPINDVALSPHLGKIEIPLVDIEKGYEKENTLSIKPVIDIIAFLPNLEV